MFGTFFRKKQNWPRWFTRVSKQDVLDVLLKGSKMSVFKDHFFPVSRRREAPMAPKQNFGAQLLYATFGVWPIKLPNFQPVSICFSGMSLSKNPASRYFPRLKFELVVPARRIRTVCVTSPKMMIPFLCLGKKQTAQVASSKCSFFSG